MPVQPGGPVLLETICRADAHDPQADVDRTVRSVHYPVAVGTVTLAIPRTRWAIERLAVIPADRLLSAQATEGLASDIQHAPPGGQIFRQAADLLFEDPARVHAVIIRASRETGQQLVSDRNTESLPPISRPEDQPANIWSMPLTACVVKVGLHAWTSYTPRECATPPGPSWARCPPCSRCMSACG